MTNVNKVRFAQTIYGRRNNGLLNKEKGKATGKGSFIVPIGKEELFREVLNRHKVSFEVKRIFIKD